MQLYSTFYLAHPLFASEQLDSLHVVLKSQLPEWSQELRVAKNEDSPGLTVDLNSSLHAALHQVAPVRHELGAAVLTGANQDLNFYLDHCNRAFPPELNCLSIEAHGIRKLEGRAGSDCLKDLFEAIVAQLPVCYAHTYDDAEFSAKNMIDDETSVEAIGVDIKEAIPGLYWLNYFGAPYVELIGRERLLSAPAFEVKSLGEGVMLAMDQSPNTWQTSAYHDREQAVIAHLGERHFFSRWDPDRKTTAPDFFGMQQK